MSHLGDQEWNKGNNAVLYFLSPWRYLPSPPQPCPCSCTPCGSFLLRQEQIIQPAVHKHLYESEHDEREHYWMFTVHVKGSFSCVTSLQCEITVGLSISIILKTEKHEKYQTNIFKSQTERQKRRNISTARVWLLTHKSDNVFPAANRVHLLVQKKKKNPQQFLTCGPVPSASWFHMETERNMTDTSQGWVQETWRLTKAKWNTANTKR